MKDETYHRIFFLFYHSVTHDMFLNVPGEVIKKKESYLLTGNNSLFLYIYLFWEQKSCLSVARSKFYSSPYSGFIAFKDCQTQMYK